MNYVAARLEIWWIINLVRVQSRLYRKEGTVNNRNRMASAVWINVAPIQPSDGRSSSITSLNQTQWWTFHYCQSSVQGLDKLMETPGIFFINKESFVNRYFLLEIINRVIFIRIYFIIFIIILYYLIYNLIYIIK